MKLGETVLLELSQISMECCAGFTIKRLVNKCILPEEVQRGGRGEREGLSLFSSRAVGGTRSSDVCCRKYTNVKQSKLRAARVDERWEKTQVTW